MDCSPLNSPGQNARVGRLSLLQGIFPTKELNPGLPYRSQILYQLSHQVSNNQDSEVTVVFSPSFPTNFKLTTAFPLLFFCSESLPLSLVQFSLVTQLCPALCDPMNCITPSFPVCHQLPEFNQTHVHWVGDAIQPSHLLSSPSPPAPNPSQHQSLFQWVNSSHEVAKVLELQL